MKQFVETRVQKPFNLIDVIIEHRHGLAHAVILKEFNLTHLNVVVSICPQIVLDSLSKVHEAVLVGPFKKALKAKDDNSQNRKENCKWPWICSAHNIRDPFRGFSADRIYHPAHKNWRHQVENFVQNAVKTSP